MFVQKSLSLKKYFERRHSQTVLQNVAKKVKKFTNLKYTIKLPSRDIFRPSVTDNIIVFKPLSPSVPPVEYY